MQKTIPAHLVSTKVFIRSILTHWEYDKEDWKNDPWYT